MLKQSESMDLSQDYKSSKNELIEYIYFILYLLLICNYYSIIINKNFYSLLINKIEKFPILIKI
jgi:hypothetical protein